MWYHGYDVDFSDDATLFCLALTVTVLIRRKLNLASFPPPENSTFKEY
jgi:hypothetical protein